MNQRIVWGIAFLILGVSMAAQASDLEALKWHYRPVVVFASAEQAEHAQATLSASNGVIERDIAWFVVTDDDVTSNIETPVERGALETLRRTSGFGVVLVGKDGSVKVRQQRRLDLPALFEAIDAMPMRQREMRSNDG